MTACVVTSVLEFLGVIGIMDLYLNFSLVVGRFEVWRLATTFVYMGELGLPFVLKMYFAIRYSRLLEEGQYRGRTADFLMLYIFGTFSLLSLSAACHFYRFTSWKPPYFLGPALVNAILYVWAKRSPYINMNFMGMFDFQAVYLPWVILGLEYLLDNGSLTFDILGIAVGHLFHFFTDVYPRTRGINLLPTPTFLKVLLGQQDRPQEPQDRTEQNAARNQANGVPAMNL
jgi:Derlin-2/3